MLHTKALSIMSPVKNKERLGEGREREKKSLSGSP